jgi:hypothetical protein
MTERPQKKKKERKWCKISELQFEDSDNETRSPDNVHGKDSLSSREKKSIAVCVRWGTCVNGAGLPHFRAG